MRNNSYIVSDFLDMIVEGAKGAMWLIADNLIDLDIRIWDGVDDIVNCLVLVNLKHYAAY